MKRICALILVLTFTVWAPCALFAQGASTPKKKERVYCCHERGKCDKLHTKAECEKDGGKVVKTCKECK